MTVSRNNNIGGTICLRPSPMQFCIVQLHLMLLCVMAAIVWITSEAGFIATCCLFIFLGLLAYLLCQALHISRIRYYLTDEQLIYEHGLFMRQTDYMELYRIIDYQETSTVMQQLTGLKDVIIHSTDKNMSILTLKGILQDNNITQKIRWRVEQIKQAKAVYEITNGYHPY